MLYRKIQPYLENYLRSDANKVLIVDGARQTGKSFIIRYVGSRLFENYIELNFAEDFNGPRLFEKARTVKDFYFQLSTVAGDKMREKENTLIFLDEIQTYPHLLTMLKFLKQDDRFTYIASGSLLGVTLKKTSSIPIGSVEVKRMYPLDFEEFLLANGLAAMRSTGCVKASLPGRRSKRPCTRRCSDCSNDTCSSAACPTRSIRILRKTTSCGSGRSTTTSVLSMRTTRRNTKRTTTKN